MRRRRPDLETSGPEGRAGKAGGEAARCGGDGDGTGIGRNGAQSSGTSGRRLARHHHINILSCIHTAPLSFQHLYKQTLTII